MRFVVTRHTRAAFSRKFEVSHHPSHGAAQPPTVVPSMVLLALPTCACARGTSSPRTLTITTTQTAMRTTPRRICLPFESGRAHETVTDRRLLLIVHRQRKTFERRSQACQGDGILSSWRLDAVCANCGK